MCHWVTKSLAYWSHHVSSSFRSIVRKVTWVYDSSAVLRRRWNQNVSELMSEWVTRSPIELSWTAKKAKGWAKCLRKMRLILRHDDDNDGGQRVGGTARNSWQPSPSLKISFHSLSFPRHDAMRGHTITVVFNHIDQIVYLCLKHSIWSLFRECFGLWKWLYS